MKPAPPSLAPLPARPQPPRLGETLGLILIAWVMIGLLVALLQLWLGSMELLHLLALLLAAGFTFVALFDYVWRRLR